MRKVCSRLRTPPSPHPVGCRADGVGGPRPQAANVLEGALEVATAIRVLPDRYRQRLRTTNAQEPLNEEIRRRERVIWIFPNRDSVIRLLGALLLDIHEKWTTGTRYLDREKYDAWCAARADTALTGTVVAMR